MSFRVVDLSLNVVEGVRDLTAAKAGEISCKTGGSADCRKRSKELSCVGTSINMIVDRMTVTAEVEDAQIDALRGEIEALVRKHKLA